MSFRFRLTASSNIPGIFDFNDERHEFVIADGLPIAIAARNSDKLSSATSFHFEAGDFPTEEAAREAAENLRTRLRLLNALLALGIDVPTSDTRSAHVADFVKQKLKKELDAVAVDSIKGAATFPDDGRHFECIVAGDIKVKPADPAYILKALKTTWPLKIKFDEPSELALHILGLASVESSERVAFLISYLALEPLIPRRKRSDPAIDLIKRFQAQLQTATKRKRHPIQRQESDSISGALRALHEESFSSALTRFASVLITPTHIRGLTAKKFFSACISARHRLSHNAELDKEVRLSELYAGLREIVGALVWKRNSLPSFNVEIPPSAVSVPPGGLSMKVL
jgi:hypothetical protein